MSKEILDELHRYCGYNRESIHFIVNLSAANAKSYVLNRPNQREQTFSEIIANLKYTQELVKKDGKGLSFTLMSVTHKDNFRDIPELVALAKDVGAMRLWIKPIEVHGEETIEYLIGEEDTFEYARHAQLALHLAELLNVRIFYSEVLEDLSLQFADKLKEYQNHTSIDEQLAQLANNSEVLQKYLGPLQSDLVSEIDTLMHLPSFCMPIQTSNDVVPQTIRRRHQTANSVNVSTGGELDSTHLALGVQNANSANDFFDYLPCKIGNEYLRIEVTGNVLPCCISNLPLNNIEGSALTDIWFSDSLNSFRNKLDKINTEKFHKYDPEWLFCQQCPHLHINSEYHELNGFKLE